ADKECTQHGDEGDGQDGRADHRRRLRERERVEHLAFHAAQREYRNEGQDDDYHREENRQTNKFRRVERDLPDVLTVIAVFFRILLGLAYHILRHDNASVDQHTYGYS